MRSSVHAKDHAAAHDEPKVVPPAVVVYFVDVHLAGKQRNDERNWADESLNTLRNRIGFLLPSSAPFLWGTISVVLVQAEMSGLVGAKFSAT